jgi:hypothetical protein
MEFEELDKLLACVFLVQQPEKEKHNLSLLESLVQ